MSKVLLGDVACEHKETCKDSKDGYPIVGLEHLIPEEITLTAWEEDKENTFTKMFRKGNVLFGRRRAYLKKAAVAPFDGICSGDITVIEAIPGKILPELLPFIIQNDALFDFAVGKSAGSLSPRVKWEHLKNYEFELPSMDKQRELAKLLWAMDDTRKAYQKLMQKTDDLVKSQFIEMFYGKGYPVKKIGDVIEKTISRVAKVFEKTDEIQYLDISSIDNSSKTVTGLTPYVLKDAPSRAQYVLKQGDIMYSTVRPNLQNIAINPYSDDNVVGSTGFCVLRCTGVTTGYMWGVINSVPFTEAMTNQASGANYPAVTDKVVHAYEIPVPPVEEQTAYEQLVKQSDKSKFAVQLCSNQNISIKKSLELGDHMNINNINVNKYPISQMFDPDSKTVFEVPKYQREYVWGTREWSALYDDLFENDEGYFLGSIICINSTTNSLSPKFEVVDGQQRLTTTSLFLAALYDILNSHKNELDEDQQSDLLQLRRKLVLKKTTQDLRVVPQLQGSNLDDYMGLMAKIGLIPQRAMPNFAGLRRIVKGFNYFRKRIENDAEESGDVIHMLFQILDKVNAAILVMIEVSNHADAYTLFESLNNRGTPLTSVDLIKNLLLARLDVTESDNLDYYFARWREVLSNLGDDYSVQERFFRQNYNAFRGALNAPFRKDDRLYPLGVIATRSTLLDIYEKLVTRDPKGFLDDLTENSTYYSAIILNKTDSLSSELRECFLDLQRVQGAPSYLFLLYLFKNKTALSISDDDIAKITRLLINFFIRRNVTDTPPTRDLTRLFMAFIEETEQSNYTGNDVYNHLRTKLISVSASDEFFAEKLHGPVYDENSGACRFILCMMAKRGMTQETYVDLWRQYDSKQYVWSIEHIFPQGGNIPQSWVDMIAGGDRAKAQEYQTLYVHTFGNLTITGYNSTLSNKSFEDKRDRKDNSGKYIGYRNGLNLNADICDKDEWTVDIIKARTDSMVKEILEMFQL